MSKNNLNVHLNDRLLYHKLKTLHQPNNCLVWSIIQNSIIIVTFTITNLIVGSFSYTSNIFNSWTICRMIINIGDETYLWYNMIMKLDMHENVNIPACSLGYLIFLVCLMSLSRRWIWHCKLPTEGNQSAVNLARVKYITRSSEKNHLGPTYIMISKLS